jgi:hypothetical protein
MKTRILLLLGLPVGLACLLSAPDAQAQISNNRLEFVTQASASAYDAEFGSDRPPDLILVLRTNAFVQLQTNVNLTRTAAVTGASAEAQAAALAIIQPLSVTLTGRVAVATALVTNRLNSAPAMAGHRFDLGFDLPCAHEASLLTFLEGSVNPGSLLGQIRLETGAEILLWRLLPGDSGRATNGFTLGPGSYRLLVEFNIGTSAASGTGGGGAAAFSLQLDLVPILPILAIGRAGANVLLSWSTNATGFRVEYQPRLDGTNWLRLFRPVIVNDNQNTVADPDAEEQRFYRLAAP